MMKKTLFFISMLYSSLAMSASGAPKITNLIPPVEYFVNHSIQLEEIEQNLKKHHKTSLSGMSGIGKTQVARKYALQNQDKYEIIWFIDSSKNLDQEFAHLAKEINSKLIKEEANKLPEDAEQAKAAVIKYLTPKHGWLLVFDNLKTHQNYIVDEILRWENKGAIIICSQDSKDMPQLITLKPFSEKDSQLVIKQIICDPSTQDHDQGQLVVKKLADTFQGYPAATTQGAIYFKTGQFPNMQDYEAALAKSKNPVQTNVQFIMAGLTHSADKLLRQIALVNNHKISLSLLQIFTNHPDTLTADLQDLSRFGLITSTEGNQRFEMHDTTKESVLALTKKRKIKWHLEDIIDKINSKIPKGVGSGHPVLANEDLRSSMEEILKNSEEFKINPSKTLELRKNLMNYYLNSGDYYNCEKMIEWLKNKERDPKFTAGITKERDKAAYSWFLAIIGAYNLIAKSDTAASVTYLERAGKILKDFTNYPELNFTIHAQLAQTRLFAAQVNEGQKSLDIAEEIIKQNPKADLDLGLFWFLKAKAVMNQGKYDQALIAIDKNIEAEAHLPRDSFTAPTFVNKAEILNYLGRYDEAYKVALDVHKQQMAIFKDRYEEMHPRILLQLARAEVHLGQKEKALANITKVVNIYMNHLKLKDLKSPELLKSDYSELAEALVSYAEILSALGHLSEAMDYFVIADTIYTNRYKENKKYMHCAAYLDWQAIQVAQKMQGQDRKHWYKVFTDKYMKDFGLNSFYDKEIIAIGKKI